MRAFRRFPKDAAVTAIDSGEVLQWKEIDGKKQVKCPECGRAFANKIMVSRHRVLRHFLGEFACNKCPNFKGAYATEYFSHCHTHPEEPNVSCPCCLKHTTPLSNEKAFEECGKTFQAQSTLAYHMNTHLGLTPYKCDEPGCDVAFNHPFKLKSHQKTHARHKGMTESETGEALYFPCDLCDARFVQHNRLKMHKKRVHMGIPETYLCLQCGEVSHSRGARRRHEVTHHGKDPEAIHNCEVCGKGFVGNYQLRRHMRVHDEAKFVCKFCGKGLKSSVALRDHEYSHTGENPISCKFCDYKCKSTTVLRKHSLAKHPDLVS